MNPTKRLDPVFNEALDRNQQMNLSEIEARLRETSAGPWTVFGDSNCDDNLHIESNMCDGPQWKVAKSVDYEPNADFIAAAKTDVPWLINLVYDLVVRINERQCQVNELRAELEASRHA